ncbi:hypothetical protein QUB68_19520 [Microcoleus sp. A006_D1]
MCYTYLVDSAAANPRRCAKNQTAKEKKASRSSDQQSDRINYLY